MCDFLQKYMEEVERWMKNEHGRIDGIDNR